MKNKMKNKKIVLSCISFFCMFAIVLGAAYVFLNNTVQKIIMQSVDELAEHDMQSISVYIRNQQLALESLCLELKNTRPEEVGEMQELLNVKVLAGRFERAYLIDEDGNLYTNTYTVYGKDENDFLSYFEENKDKFVYRYDDKNRYHEIKKEYLMYGLNFEDEPLKISGINFVGAIGLNDISKIQDKIKITSFDGKSYSTIVNKSGYYIINLDQTSSLNKFSNFYELLDNGKIYGDLTLEEIKQKMINDESCKFYYKNENNKKKYISIKPMDDSIWFFVNSVETSVFSELTMQFVIIVLTVIAVLILLLAVLFYVNKSTNRKLKKLYSAVIDGVYNRHYYDEKLADQKINALAMIDLDHLKHINDNYGHIAGDHAIEAIAKILLKDMGGYGDVVRYGGDEFAVAIKEDIPAEKFKNTLETVLNDTRKTILEKFPEVKLTLSIGGYYGEGKTISLFKDADELLYEAKKKRNSLVTNI